MNRVLEKMASEPFRIFFPIGVVCASLAVLFWPIKVFSLGWENLSSKVHSHLQIFGFLLAFIIGFITTALPRLTKANTLTLFELFVLLIDFIVLQGFIFTENHVMIHVMFLITVISLLFVLARRFLTRKRKPPHTFIYVPFGFLCAVAGAVLQIGVAQQWIHLPAGYESLANRLIFQAFIIFLLLGVGGFLIRSILGFAQPLPEGPNDQLILPPENRKLMLIHFLLSVVLVVSFVFDTHPFQIVRALIVTAVVFYQIKAHRKSISGKLTAYTLQFSMWMLIAGCWSLVLFPEEYATDLMHFAFIGGFSLSAIGVATRVILSHCNHSSLLSQYYRPFSIAIALMTLGLLTRVLAVLMADYYYHHLAYAALSWLCGLWIWSAYILKKCIKDTFC